jgi:hypothetical protein
MLRACRPAQTLGKKLRSIEAALVQRTTSGQCFDQGRRATDGVEVDRVEDKKYECAKHSGEGAASKLLREDNGRGNASCATTTSHTLST